MDVIDRKILRELQADASISIAELADRVGLSQTPCWKRVQKLEAAGVIVGRVALLAPEKLGLGLTVFVSIGPENPEVPSFDGMSLEDYTEAVEALGLTVGSVSNADDPSAPEGRVLQVSPDPGVAVKRGDAIGVLLEMGVANLLQPLCRRSLAPHRGADHSSRQPLLVFGA